MKNIYEDETLPSGNAKPPMPRNDSKAPMPSRPRRQVTPPPMKQMPTQPVYMPPQPTAPQPGAYPYQPYPPQGQPYPQGVAYYPVYDPNTQQPVYPQGVPYVPYGYMPPQGAPMPTAPQQVEEEPKEEYDPGTRVLYQSPDFDNHGDSAVSENVGTDFANMMKQANEEAEKEKDEEITEVPVSNDIDYEEVSIDLPKTPSKKPPVIKSAPPIISTSTLTDEDIYTDTKTGDISFSAYNAVKPSMDVEDFEQELPPYEEEDEEEFTDEDVAETDNIVKKFLALPKSEIIRRSVLVVAIIAIVISSAMLLNEWRLSVENDNLMEEVEGLIDTEPTTNKKDKDKNKDKTTTEALSPEEQWAQVKEDYPNVLFPANIQLRYAKLYGENQDFVGYISIDAFNLNR